MRKFAGNELNAIKNAKNESNFELNQGIILYDWDAGTECVIINADNKSITLVYPDENGMINEDRMALWNKNDLRNKMENEDNLTFVDWFAYDFYLNMYSGKIACPKTIAKASEILPF